jgi:uncharacterized phage protein gp47/JayE
MPYPYEPPDFLKSQSVDEIHRRILNTMPDDIDKSELQIPWDFTRPAAIAKSEFVEFELNEAIKTTFVLWANGKWLDYHAQEEGLTRREANHASGELIIKVKPGLIVEKSFLFTTPANLTSGVIFETIETVVCNGDPDANGQVTAIIPVQAFYGGTSGNVPPDTVILMVKPDSDIFYVSNPKAMTGGTPEESDDELRERILEAIRRGISWTGCDADYVRWAKEVAGVGQAITDPEWDDPNMPEEFHWTDINGIRHCAGAVRLFIIDANSIPANQQIIDAVYNHIIRPDNRMERKAPIGATLTVVAPSPLFIKVLATVTLKEGEILEKVIERFKANLDKYWLAAASENDIRDVQTGIAQNNVKYVYVGSTLAETAGIANYDHNTLLVNGGTDDILIPLGEYPVTLEVDIIEYS